MKQLLHLIISISALFFQVTNGFSQGTNCGSADPFCTGTTYTFPNSTNVADLGEVDCLGSSPNPAWYYMEIDQNGPMTINISQVDVNGVGIDVDFILWGPYASLSAACATSLMTTSGVDCSYSTAASETATIPNAVIGQTYVLLLTNYANDPGTISFSQSGGSGSSDCSLLCGVQSFTANASACNSSTNTYDVSGALVITNPPASGTLTISNSCGGSQIFNAPFSTTINYSLAGLTANGNACTVSATFSADGTCNTTVNYTAPASCATVCNISAISTTPGAVNCVAQTYDLTGAITFANAPATGTLTITSSCGGSQTFNAPFTSAQTYTLTNLPANGSNCTVTAVFSATPACMFTTNFSAPSLPTAAASNNGPVCENGSINLSTNVVAGATYAWSGPGGYTSTQQNPIINPITVAGSGTYTVTVTLNGCSVSSSTTITVNPSPTVTAGNAIAVCEGSSINLTSSTVSNAIYSWTGPNGFTSSQQNPSITPSDITDEGIYIVTITLNGCTSLPDTIDVTVTPIPVVVASNNGIICEGEDILLSSSNVPGATYAWTGPDGFTSTSQNPIITGADGSDAGVYSVIVTINGCSSNPSSTTVAVSIISATFSATPQSGVAPLDVIFTNTSTGANAYTWDYGNGSTQNTSGLITNQQYLDTGVYIVTMIAVNTDGCADTTSLFINVVPDYFIFIPNVFSPNGDHTNDLFQLQLSGVSTIDVEIYNRWGKFLYSFNTLTGSWNGNEASEGTYYYIIKLMDVLNVEHIYSGAFTLTR